MPSWTFDMESLICFTPARFPIRSRAHSKKLNFWLMMEVTVQSQSYSEILGFSSMWKNQNTMCLLFSMSKNIPHFMKYYRKSKENEKKLENKLKPPIFTQALLHFQNTTLVFLLMCSVFSLTLSNAWCNLKYISQK